MGEILQWYSKLWAVACAALISASSGRSAEETGQNVLAGRSLQQARPVQLTGWSAQRSRKSTVRVAVAIRWMVMIRRSVETMTASSRATCSHKQKSDLQNRNAGRGGETASKSGAGEGRGGLQM